MKEGTVATPKSKFFLIQHGECIVEKNISIQVSNPQDKNKPSVQNTQTAQIAVIGN